MYVNVCAYICVCLHIHIKNILIYTYLCICRCAFAVIFSSNHLLLPQTSPSVFCPLLPPPPTSCLCSEAGISELGSTWDLFVPLTPVSLRSNPQSGFGSRYGDSESESAVGTRILTGGVQTLVVMVVVVVVGL